MDLNGGVTLTTFEIKKFRKNSLVRPCAKKVQVISARALRGFGRALSFI